MTDTALDFPSLDALVANASDDRIYVTACEIECESLSYSTPSMHGLKQLLDPVGIRVSTWMGSLGFPRANSLCQKQKPLPSRCKSFEDPVLDVLWKSQDRPLPLVKSFPGDVWKAEAGRFVSSLIAYTSLRLIALPVRTSQGTPTKAERSRFQKYARSGRLQGPSNFRCSINTATSHRQ